MVNITSGPHVSFIFFGYSRGQRGESKAKTKKNVNKNFLTRFFLEGVGTRCVVVRKYMWLDLDTFDNGCFRKYGKSKRKTVETVRKYN